MSKPPSCLDNASAAASDSEVRRLRFKVPHAWTRSAATSDSEVRPEMSKPPSCLDNALLQHPIVR